ncbi:MAG: dTDP-4-dehydrorhamnose reductase [Terrimicrobiaceae bacterium]
MSKILILGSRGRLGAALVRRWSGQNEIIGLARPDVDFTRPDELDSVLEAHPADVVVNCTGLTSLEQCEEDPALAHLVNSTSPGVLAKACAARDTLLVHFSTDYVFDGATPGLRKEEDPARPVSVYGQSKLEGEMAVAAADPRHLIFRVSWVFGPDKPSFVDMILRRALESDRVEAVADKESSPSFTHDIADWVAPFLNRTLPGGIYHACNAQTCSWRDLGQATLDLAASNGWPLLTTSVEPLTLADMATFRAARPRFTAMDCSKLAATTGHAPRPWMDALREYLNELPRP